jgi:hypothetical protein
MSSSFLRRVAKFFTPILDGKLTKDLTKPEILFRTSISSMILAGHGIYVFSTEKKEAITVVKKYTMDRNGFTDFMIVDDKGRHFNVNNSLWYWKWDSIEDWHKIDEKSEEKLFIKYYGWRVPVFGLFPNIVISNNQKFLDSISRSEYCRFEVENLL